MKVALQKSDLLGPRGGKISAKGITLTPDHFTIAPNSKREVRIDIKIQKSCMAGTYTGLLHDMTNPDLHAVLAIRVQR